MIACNGRGACGPRPVGLEGGWDPAGSRLTAAGWLSSLISDRAACWWRPTTEAGYEMRGALGRRPSGATVIAVIALVLAASGTPSQRRS
jgi:hypothetical protein